MAKRTVTEEIEPSRKKLKIKPGKDEKHAEDKPGTHEKKKTKDINSKSSSGSDTTSATTSQSEIDEFMKSNTIEISDSLNKEHPPAPILSFDQLPERDHILYEPLKKFSAPT